MQRNLRIFFLAIFMVIVSPLGFSVDPLELKKINHKIANIKIVLSEYQNKRAIYLKKLKLAEIASNQTRFRLQKIELDLRKQTTLLQKIKQNENCYKIKILKQNQGLAQLIRSAYMLKGEPYLKLILNQNDSNRVARLLIYYHYFVKQHLNIIQNLQIILNQLQSSQTEIKTQTAILKKLQKQERETHIRLELQKQDRQQAISHLNNEIKNKNQRLYELLTNKQTLENTLNNIKRYSKHEAVMNVDFEKLKGYLPWPTKGTLIPYFGTSIDHSELKWDAVLITAPENQPVYAIASGEVVFAKWLPGYGFLLIINHGHGYMTLYGRNHFLYKKSGDLVQKGDLVATVGQSGGYEKPALYFAIRHNAKPLNPLQWCRGRINEVT